MKKSRAELSYDELRNELLTLGFVRPGSLVRRFERCGKRSCKCKAEPPVLHGPYYQWTHKVGGKTVTMRLTEEQARLCAEWKANHREFRRLMKEMEKVSLRETNRLLRLVKKRSKP